MGQWLSVRKLISLIATILLLFRENRPYKSALRGAINLCAREMSEARMKLPLRDENAYPCVADEFQIVEYLANPANRWQVEQYLIGRQLRRSRHIETFVP
jgi:hypothetical protein